MIDNKQKISIESVQAINYIYNHSNINKTFEEVLLNLKYKDKKFINKITVQYIRKNISYIKNIYIIMTESMEENIKRVNNIIHYFIDVTYYATPI